MSTEIKLYKAQSSKIIQTGGVLESSLSKLAGLILLGYLLSGKGIVRAGCGSQKGRADYGKEWEL